MEFIFVSPFRYVQGPGTIDSLGRFSRYLGTRALVVLPTILENLWPQVKAALAQEGIEGRHHPFGGECCDLEVDGALATLPKSPADFVIGVGGGKALDTAKAVAWKAGLASVMVPTIAATDAPTSAASVIYTPAGEFEKIYFYPTSPNLILVDTAIIARAPARFLISGMGDAISTKFEAHACLRSGRRTVAGGRPTLAAIAIADLCYDTVLKYGPQAAADVNQQQVTDAVEKVVEANTLLSGLGFESGGLAAAHSIHNGLTALHSTHAYWHGEKVAFSTIAHLMMEDNPSQAREVAEFCKTVGLPIHLGQLAVDAGDLAALKLVAEKACAPAESIHNMPFPVSPDMVVNAIVAAHELGMSIAG